MDHNDEQEITRLFEDGDRALMSADVAEMERIYAKDYVQSDESGRLFTRADVIRNFTTGKIQFLSMKSTGRQVRLFGAFAIVHAPRRIGSKRKESASPSTTSTWMLSCGATGDGKSLRDSLQCCSVAESSLSSELAPGEATLSGR